MSEENIVMQSPEVNLDTGEVITTEENTQETTDQAEANTQESAAQGETSTWQGVDLADSGNTPAQGIEADSEIIMPTVGRVVWYHPDQHMSQPYAATVAFVWSERMINISYVDHNGVQRNATKVQLVQPCDAAPSHGYCCWMPYQVNVAKKQGA